MVDVFALADDLVVQLQRGQLDALLAEGVANRFDLTRAIEQIEGIEQIEAIEQVDAIEQVEAIEVVPTTISHAPEPLLPGIETIPTVSLPERELSDMRVALLPEGQIGSAALLEPALLCGSGWRPEAFVQVKVRGPDGGSVAERYVEIEPDGSLSAVWRPRPGEGLGRYRLTVSDGGFETSGSVDVVVSDELRLVVLSLLVGVPGGTFEIGIAGYAPESTVAVHAYRLQPTEPGPISTWDYVGTFAGIEVGSDGGAVQLLSTVVTDPPGYYCLLADGMSYDRSIHCSNAGFALAEQ